MSKRISTTTSNGWIDVSVPPAMADEFKTMVTRAIQTWQDMSPQMRDFADRVLGREDSMGQNMKWDLPAEDKYELAKMTAVTAERCPKCLMLPCTCVGHICNCTVHDNH